MRVIIAIARQAIAGAIRSRVVGTLIALLALGIVALPLVIKGDGTQFGKVHVMLSYTVGLTLIILSFSAIWAGCAAISQEIQPRQAHVLMTKPVRTIQLWLGKWLGLFTLHGVLMVAAGLGIYAQLMWTVNAHPSEEEAEQLREEVLVARTSLGPSLEALNKVLSEELARHDGEHLNESQRSNIARNVLQQAFTVTPTHSPTWEFPLPPSDINRHSLLFRFQFNSSQLGSAKIPGTWIFSAPDGTVCHEVKDTYVSVSYTHLRAHETTTLISNAVF